MCCVPVPTLRYLHQQQSVMTQTYNFNVLPLTNDHSYWH